MPSHPAVVNPPVAAIRASGILPRLVALLRKDDQRTLQYECAWTLVRYMPCSM